MSKIQHDSSNVDLRSLSGQIAESVKPGDGAETVMSSITRDPDSLSMSALSIMLVSPSADRRQAIGRALAGPQASVARELTKYPDIDDLGPLLEADYDVMIVDLDGDPERALDLVEGVCGANSSITVMVFSNRADQDLLVRCMRAGAREFLADPIQPGKIGEALVRASARRQEARRQKKTAGKMLVFVGAKGGSGVTTVGANFAVALARESRSKVALVDLELQLGDAALTLGLSAQFSIADALENVHRLDSDFLSTLLIRHDSGVSVLAAPDNFGSFHPSTNGVEKLLRILRDDFPYVVVDAGAYFSDIYGMLFEIADTVYLVTQVNVPELRNANRLVNRYFTGAESGKLQVVLNRFTSRALEIDDNGITKALTRPASWKLPNEYAAVRRAQDAGTPIALDDGAVSRGVAAMARAACGQTVQPEKKRRFGLFG
ncbi:MAG TPA: AAA family ATPase [Bryobacteraceae bacterium]|nr:AAA family ATPase [Bryobacteraceae bacterium]